MDNTWNSQMRLDHRASKEQHKKLVYLEPIRINMESVSFIIITF